MASIQQKQLFVWSDIEEVGDVERLKLVLEAIPDEELMKKLETKRGPSGVNKYPVRAVWNSIVAMIVYGHPTIESLRRELKRNPLLLQVCGFNVRHGIATVPTAGSYSRFFRTLEKYRKEIRKLFDLLLQVRLALA